MLLNWGCRTLLESAELLSIQDPLTARWQEVLAKLTPYPTGPDGLMIGAGTPSRSRTGTSRICSRSIRCTR